MKKILTTFLLLGFFVSLYGQDAADKKLLAGITVGGGMSFNSPQTFSIDAKVGGDFFVGMALDWDFSDNIGLSTGLSFDFNSFTTLFEHSQSNNKIYFNYLDKEVLRKKDLKEGENYKSFMLDSRKETSIYAVLPIMLKFQTKYLGYFRYFGKFGIRNSFLLTTKSTNKGVGYKKSGLIDNKVQELEKMKTKGFMNFYKGSIGLSAGAMYNVTGTTVIVAEIGYYYGFTQIFQQKGALFGDGEKDSSLYRYDSSVEKEYYTPSLKQGQLMIKVSVLF